jgi:hypothetical protein
MTSRHLAALNAKKTVAVCREKMETVGIEPTSAIA